MWLYGVSLLMLILGESMYAIALIILITFSVPIVLIAMGGYAAYVGCLLVFAIAIAILLTGGFAVYAGAALNSAFAESEKPVTDVSRYQEFRLSPYLFPEVVNHFPSEIPSDGENIYLYFIVGFRRTYDFQLRMKLPPEQIEKIQARFRLAAILKYIPGRDDNSINDELRYGINAGLRYGDRLHSDEIEDRSCLKNYELLVLKKTYCPGGRSLSYGVAIDSSVSEVIYWTNGW